MKTVHYLFIIVLVSSVFFVQYDLSRREELVKAAKLVNANITAKVAPVQPTPTQTVIVQDNNVPTPKVFAARFKKEALQIAKIQKDPELAQNRMKTLAKAMAPEDVQDLFEIMSDDKNNGDQRALAVELLSLKNDTTSLIALQNFVANSKNINGMKWDRKNELETILRAQAVESIAAYPQKDIARSTLSYLLLKVDEKFLNDRIGRASASLNNTNTPTPQQQDDAALTKLLE